MKELSMDLDLYKEFATTRLFGMTAVQIPISDLLVFIKCAEEVSRVEYKDRLVMVVENLD